MKSPRIASLVGSLAACGSSTTSPDTTTLTGSAAFGVISTMMVPGGLHCRANGALPNGQYEALSIIAADVDQDTTSCTSGHFDFQPHDVRIELATGEGYYGSGSSHAPIAAGMTFPILNERVTDEDLCGNVPSTTTGPLSLLMLTACAGTECHTMFAGSGSVTVTEVSGTTVAGTFDVALRNQDEEDQGALSGTFAADTCP